MKTPLFWTISLTIVAGLYLNASRRQDPPTLRVQSTGVAASPVGNTVNGERLFVKYGCFECHGYEGQGGAAGSRLAPNPLPLETLKRYVRAPRGVMPPYTVALLPSDQDLVDIHAFLASRPKAASLSVLPR